MPVRLADDPLTCVVRGTGIILQEVDTLEKLLVPETYQRPLR
jgi:rod shape-determining protein MreB